jgi:hypothetical protein
LLSRFPAFNLGSFFTFALYCFRIHICIKFHSIPQKRTPYIIHPMTSFFYCPQYGKNSIRSPITA